MAEQFIISIGELLSSWLLIPVLLGVSVWFSVSTRFVQIRMAKEMVLQLFSGSKHRGITSFQAFAVSIASRVGTGNLAGVATAIYIGGPGAVFWMWVTAILGAASAFAESTLAQLYKRHDGKGGFVGGPAFYIMYGLGKKWWAVLFAVLISLTFGLAYNSVQSNTVCEATYNVCSLPPWAMACVITVAAGVIICGGLKSVARFSELVVPPMALAYILLAAVVVVLKWQMLPGVICEIVENAFGVPQAIGGTFGMAMAIGIRRGLFSNEAGEGSAPNVAATANVSHPVKQGLVQALGVYTDTLLVCTATAFIILLSGVAADASVQSGGIGLTQSALDRELNFLPGAGTWFVGVAILFFAFTSIVANYYYGETNIRFITRSKFCLWAYRCLVLGFVLCGGVMSLDLVWSLADITMTLMALCNLCAIVPLGRYALLALKDYKEQRGEGKDPEYHRHTIPEIEAETPCWPR